MCTAPNEKFYVLEIPWNHFFVCFYSRRVSIWNSSSIREFTGMYVISQKNINLNFSEIGDRHQQFLWKVKYEARLPSDLWKHQKSLSWSNQWTCCVRVVSTFATSIDETSIRSISSWQLMECDHGSWPKLQYYPYQFKFLTCNSGSYTNSYFA